MAGSYSMVGSSGVRDNRPCGLDIWDDLRMENFFTQRLAHPRREWKPEFKEGRYPPLDVPSCSAA